jgi:hypothetical protein
LLGQFPDEDAQLKYLFKVVCDIEYVAAHTPGSVGESEQWSSIVNIAEENRQNFCTALNGKTLFSALYGTYTVALQDLKALLKASSPAGKSETTKCAASQKDGFNNLQLYWLFPLGKIPGIKDHELQLVPLVHPFL